MIFDNDENDNSNDTEIIDNTITVVDKIPKLVLSKPLKEPFKVLKGFTGRINRKLYNFVPGDDFDGSLVNHRKLETLINTRYLKKV